MRARVTEISSGQQYTDGERRVTLRVEEADSLFNCLRIPLSKLGLGNVELDQEVELSVGRQSTEQRIEELARKVAPGSFGQS